MNIPCPLPKDVVVEKGRIGSDGEVAASDGFRDFYIGELFDVCTVAMGLKPLAGLDYSNGPSKYIVELTEQHNTKSLMSDVIVYCNAMNCKYIEWTEATHYLKTIFYLDKNRDNALKLLLILNTDYYDSTITSNVIYQVAIGYLLGYDQERILGFLLRKSETSFPFTF